MGTCSKKILAIGPILPQWSDIDGISCGLNFLIPKYEITFLDPLADISSKITKESFYQRWFDRLEKEYVNYDAFLGFSFGGVILQQCFKLFEKTKKPMVLFSTPSFVNDSLYQKLAKIVDLIEMNRLEDAIVCLNTNVFHPYPSPDKVIVLDDAEKTALRMSQGFKLILDTDSQSILKNTMVDYLHLVGKESSLVNHTNVIKSVGQLEVPHSGMRVLQDNLPYCIKMMMEIL